MKPGTGWLLSLVRFHLELHPGFGPADLAKLLYQGALGMDHLLTDRERFAEEFQREWQQLDPDFFPGEPLLEPVHPARPVFRVNLRPARRRGIDVAVLGTALADQPLRGGTWDELEELWAGVVRLAKEGRLPFTPAELQSQEAQLAETGHPPRHSPHYRALNLPAYRLIHDLEQPAFRPILEQAGNPGGSRGPTAAGT